MINKNLEELCKRKIMVEEMLFPTGLSCEECGGYDSNCELYETDDKKIIDKFDEKGYYK